MLVRSGLRANKHHWCPVSGMPSRLIGSGSRRIGHQTAVHPTDRSFLVNRFDDKARPQSAAQDPESARPPLPASWQKVAPSSPADISETGLEQTLNAAKDAGHSDRLTTVKVDISSEESVREQVGAAIKALARARRAGQRGGHSALRAHPRDDTRFLEHRHRGQPHRNFPHDEGVPAGTARKAGQGVVVNFSSTSATFAHPYMTAYAASKGGIQSFTHALALEYSKQGLRAVAVAPGSIASGMTSDPGFPADIDFTLLGKLAPAIGEGFAPPSAVAGVIAMLASEDGSFVTGTEIRIDGGTHM